jgi:hypothetical protein
MGQTRPTEMSGTKYPVTWGSTSSARLRRANMTVNVRNTEACSRKYCYNGKAINIIHLCVCLYSCLSYPACKSHIFCAVFYCHLWPLSLFDIVPNYLTNGTIFGKMLLNIKCEVWFSLKIMSETFLILRRIQRDMYIHFHVKNPPFLSYFNPISIFSTDFKKILKYQISWKSI